MKERCEWALKSKSEQDYHDNDWGVPIHDDRLLFELLILEGQQAGLSWSTILNKRANYKKAFDDFDPGKIIKYDPGKIDQLLSNQGIVRNKLKINSVVSNAQAFLKIQKDHGSFSKFIWDFVDGKPIQNKWNSSAEVPSNTEISDRLSKTLKKLGFKFIGTTICYAFMQSAGMVNDHIVSCYRHKEIEELSKGSLCGKL